MKRLAFILTAVLLCSTAFAQQVRVIDINPDIDIDVDVKQELKRELKAALKQDIKIDLDVAEVLEVALADLSVDFSRGDRGDRSSGKDMANYQQNTQELDIPLSEPGKRGVLQVETHNGRLTIKAYDGPSVKVKMIKYGKKVAEDKGNGGMRRIGGGNFNVEASEYKNVVKVESEGWGDRIDFEIQVPKNFNIKAESYNNGHIWIEGVEGLMDVESYNGPITLVKIKGAVTASTYNGAVKAEFLDVEADTPMAFTTYNGDVDITLPATAKISTKMKTNRDIFTDFDDFSVSNSEPVKRQNSRGRQIKFENWTEGSVNGGGPKVLMKTTNGNIYIRKGN